MILRLTLFVLAYIAAGATTFLLARRLVQGALRDRLETRRRRHLGEENLRRVTGRASEVCGHCLLPVDPATDLFDRSSGWLHAACRERLFTD